MIKLKLVNLKGGLFMPLVDKPLKELQEYMGINPCPADFDKFWDERLAEIEKMNYDVEFVKVDYPSDIAEMYDLYFTGTMGARIHCRFAKPKNVEGKLPAVINFHGLSGSCDTWYSSLGYVSHGYVFVMMDSRGQGGTSEDLGGATGSTYSTPFIRGIDDVPEKMYQTNLFLDTAILAKIIMNLEYVDETRVGCYGGSQGGGLSIACAALVPEIKNCFAVYPYLSDYRRVWEMDLDKDAFEGLRYYFRKLDPLHEREDEIFTKLGYVDIQNFAKRIKANVVMATGLMDTIVPPSTQFAMYNKLNCNKKTLIYPDYGHEGIIGMGDKIFEFMATL